MSEQTDQPVIILVRGLPGSGKSYIATELQKSIGVDKVVALDPDAVDTESVDYRAHTEELTKAGVDKALHLYRFLRAKAYQGIADRKVIIWNQPFTNLEIFNKMVYNFHAQAAANGTAVSILVAEVGIDPAVAKERIELRKRSGGHGPSETTFARFVNDYQSFANTKYEVVRVSGTDDVRQSVATIVAALERLA